MFSGFIQVMALSLLIIAVYWREPMLVLTSWMQMTSDRSVASGELEGKRCT